MITLLILIKIFIGMVQSKYKKMVQRSAMDEDYRNDILSFTYIFTEHGPSVTASGVTALILNNGESWLQISGAIIAGIVFKHYGRKIRNVFMEHIRIEKMGMSKT